MILRLATLDDLPGLLRLYRILNSDDPIIEPQEQTTREHWRRIMDDPRLRYYVIEHLVGPSPTNEAGAWIETTGPKPAADLASATSTTLVSTCTLALIPNLTRGLRSYGVIENVVTDPAYRNQGLGTRVLRFALSEAWREGCYKVMLSTGSKQECTLRFYEQAGFRRGVKTGFVAHPP
jgi:GNAT superfamily N-acetyltransferase